MTTQTEQTTAQATDTDTVDHHWILTIQRANGLMSCRSGVHALPTGMTRDEALRAIADEYFPGERQLIVLFFSLEPNQI
ncbi:hypothetical protein ACWGH4_00425 [Streptomyces sp. NPDC054847]